MLVNFPPYEQYTTTPQPRFKGGLDLFSLAVGPSFTLYNPMHNIIIALSMEGRY